MFFQPENESSWEELNLVAQDYKHGPMLAGMIRQQYDHNLNQAGPDWCRSGHPWLRYARAELYELMEHYNSYKHWKKHDPDVEQARLELIDVFIFFISSVIEKKYPLGFVPILSRRMEEFDDQPFPTGPGVAKTVNQACEALVQYSFHGHVDTQRLARLAHALGLDAERFHLLYQLKMALNHLREEKGYKQGNYQKRWFGMEDNVFMQRYIIEDPEMRGIVANSEDVQRIARKSLRLFYEKATATKPTGTVTEETEENE